MEIIFARIAKPDGTELPKLFGRTVTEIRYLENGEQHYQIDGVWVVGKYNCSNYGPSYSWWEEVETGKKFRM